MAERENLSVGQLDLTDRMRPLKSWTVAKPPPNPKTGDQAHFSNGKAGQPGWAEYDGTNWKLMGTSTTISAS